MRIANQRIFNATAVAADAGVSSPPIWLGHAKGLCVQLSWAKTGSPDINGSFIVEISCDDGGTASGEFNPAVPPVITNWSALSGATVSATANGNAVINLPDVMSRWARVRFVQVSGSGAFAVSGRANTKGF